MSMASARLLLTPLLFLAGPLTAQEWNSEAARAIVSRAVALRASVRQELGLRDFHAHAHGFVFFLGQFGEGFRSSPRLIKSDQLELEIYWSAPDRSKQIIIGRRDRRDLPTDIAYHRDHLGVVQNNFGDRIRLGEGDEVRNVPHPLSRAGLELYEFAINDSLTIRLPSRDIHVFEVLVRPRNFDAARVVGKIFLDVEQGAVVRFIFNFTRQSYLDDTIEDITLSLDNGLWDGKYWLPREQEVEIRRRTRWLDFPARGIIRGRWEIDGYDINKGVNPAIFNGPEIVNAPPAVRDSFHWAGPLDRELVRMSEPARQSDLDRTRRAILENAVPGALSGLKRSRLATGSISDLVHFNRVEGFTPGFGWSLRPGSGRWEARAKASFGFSDTRPKGSLMVERVLPGGGIGLEVSRRVRDAGDIRPVSGLVNSLLAQEAGNDYGDYALVTRALVRIRHRIGNVRSVLEAGYMDADDMAVETDPARGRFRINPALGHEPLATAGLSLEYLRVAGRIRAEADVSLKGGASSTRDYGRVGARVKVQREPEPLGFAVRVEGGWASSRVPLLESFVMGGRGTMVGERFRAWGGRRMFRFTIEPRIRVPVPGVPVGSFATTGNRLILAPYATLASAGGRLAGAQWLPSEGLRTVLGVAVEWPYRLVRVEVGWSLDRRSVGVTVDLSREFWPIL